MKKKLVLMMVVGTLLLSACGSSEKVIEGEVKNTEETAGEQTAETEEAQAPEEGTNKGYVFIYNDVVMEMDAEAEPVIAQLGEADSYFEHASCAFDGLDKIYTYSSFEINTYPSEDKDYISSIVFKDDTITTAEGIGIGDSVDKVKEVYGADAEEENGAVILEKDDMLLTFIIQDEAVASIEYSSTILDE